ncbi:MAG: proP8 [Alphaproteobacteria bacterium]|jgi:MFS family permease|nr:proP8 [Alphaproteobacteria bacterium]
MRPFSSLNREQKESIGLLQIGTFLEYFDLMLYVHMAVLLNEIFFPKTDPHTVSLLGSLAFCSTFIFRPIGALIFGWVGDRIGRKSTIVVTTSIMAFSCIVMAILPTYAQIGISAAWIMMLCRMLQGMSSMGEIIGAQIYLTESIARPASYPAVASLNISTALGGLVALGVAVVVTSFPNLNWRYAFWIGATIAIVGAVARTRLRETPDFLKMKRQWLKTEIHKMNLEGDPIHGAEINATWKEPVQGKTLISFFLIQSGWPLCFYLAFLYFTPVLRESFGYSSENIIRHNFFLALILVISNISLTYLSCYFHPIRILKLMGTFVFFLMVFMPYWVLNLTSPFHLFLMQTLILLLPLNSSPANAIFMAHFPLYRRFTYAGLLFSFSQAVMFVVTSFGLTYLGNYFGPFGIWIISLPITLAYLYGVYHFKDLESKQGIYPALSRV